MNLLERNSDELEGDIVDQAGLARIVGVSAETVRMWGRTGMPFEKGSRPGAPHKFRTARAIHWLLQRAAATQDSVASRLAAARLAKLERENARENGRYSGNQVDLATFRKVGIRCSRRELSDILRVRISTILDWHGAGLPCEMSLATGEETYWTRQVIEWIAERERVAPGSTMHKLGEVGPDDDEPAAA